MGSLRRKLSFANVTSLVALFVALGGTGYAISELEKDDVASKHIKNGGIKNKDIADNAVTSPKVANGSLLGEDFAAGQLPQGPRGQPGVNGSPDSAQDVLDKLKTVDTDSSGLNADTVDGLQAATFMAANAGDHTWLSLESFRPGWSGGGSNAPACYRDALGIIHFRGLITRTEDVFPLGEFVAVAPAACRPADQGKPAFGAEVNQAGATQDEVGMFFSSSSGAIYIDSNPPADNNFLSLDPISYPAN